MQGAVPGQAPSAAVRARCVRWPSAATAFAAALLVLGVPEVMGRLWTPAGAVWTGSPDVTNYPTYLAKIAWGAAGHWAYADAMTPGPTAAAPIYLPYLLLGHLQAWLGGTGQGWYQGARVVLAAGAVALWWAYCRQKWSGVRGPVSFWLGLLASWWAWDGFTALGRRWSAFDWWPGGHAAQILALAPHYGIIGLALIGVLWLGERARAGVGWAWAPAFMGEAALTLTYPWLCPLPLLAPWAGVRSRAEAKRLVVWSILSGAGAVPYGLVLLWSLRHVPWLAAWRAQSALSAAPLPVVLGLSYGATGPLAVGGAGLALVRRDRGQAEMLAWAAAAIVGSYVVPIPNAREMTILLSLPLGALAATAVLSIYARLGLGLRVAWVAVLAFVLGAGASTPVAAIVRAPLQSPWQPAAVRAAIRHVAAEDPGAVVMADPGTSLWIPAWSQDRLRPYVAHFQETLDYAQLQPAVEAFWVDSTPAERAAWLQARGIRWLIWSEAANARLRHFNPRGWGWNPWPASTDADVAGARAVWAQDGVTVWQIPPTAASSAQ
jgi:hypothetical protein